MSTAKSSRIVRIDERQSLKFFFSSFHLVDRSIPNTNERYWIFSTRGLCTVAQDELIFIFNENVINPDEIISDLLVHIHQIYLDATKGKSHFIRNSRQILSNDF